MRAKYKNMTLKTHINKYITMIDCQTIKNVESITLWIIMGKCCETSTNKL